MICELLKELPQKYRQQLYQDPIISSCLFRSLDEFQQQIIFRFITESGQIKFKQLERIINLNNQQVKMLWSQANDKFESLGLISYIQQQKLYRINQRFSLNLQNYIYSVKIRQPSQVIPTEEQQSYLNETQPLLNLLFESNLKQFLSHCNLNYIDLNRNQNFIDEKIFNFIRATNGQRIGILIRGFIKFKNNIKVLKHVLSISLLQHNKIYAIESSESQLINQLSKIRLVKKFKQKYFIISKNLYHFAFEQKIIDEGTDLKCKIIIETNFKVYVEVKSKDERRYSIIKSIMKQLLSLEHGQYDFEQLIVGAITQERMERLFDKNITTDQYFDFFRQYMDKNLSTEKDLGKWKKLKFLGLQGPNSDYQIPNNVKQQVKLWEKLKKQKLNYQIETLNFQSSSD